MSKYPQYAGRQLRQLQRERGLCSEPDCSQPIDGWCDTCDMRQGPRKAPKLCERHLAAHTEPTGHAPYRPYGPLPEPLPDG